MQTYYKICVFFVLGIPIISGLEKDVPERNQKLISSFQIVRFPNDACVGSATRNGTCYTSQECADKSGTSSGSCADGFGVCCTFVVNECGGTTSENSTAWTMPDDLPATANTCGLTVCPSTDICSLRLDFTTFVITGPSTKSTMSVRRRLGTPVGNILDLAYVAEGSSYATNCLVDIFTATSASSSSSPPAVCGNLQNEHMYVEADSDRCNMLQFNLGANGAVLPAAGTTTDRGVAAFPTRNWDITISHIECTSSTLPPAGCTKYYFSPLGVARLTSYNFGTAAGSSHLASQHERFCVRQERGNCIGCFSAAAVINVQISGSSAIAAVHTQAGSCCGYHTQDFGALGVTNTLIQNVDGMATATTTQPGFDCLIIPGAFVSVTTAVGAPTVHGTAAIATTNLQATLVAGIVGNVPAPPQICGNGAGLGIGAADLSTAANDQGAAVQAGAAVNLSICTRNAPFTLEFMSDDLEGQGATAAQSENVALATNNRGFQIEVTQLPCTAAAG